MNSPTHNKMAPPTKNPIIPNAIVLPIMNAMTKYAAYMNVPAINAIPKRINKDDIYNYLINKRTSQPTINGLRVSLVYPVSYWRKERTNCVKSPTTIGILYRNTWLWSYGWNNYTKVSTCRSKHRNQESTCNYDRTYNLFHFAFSIKLLINALRVSNLPFLAKRSALAFWEVVTHDSILTNFSIRTWLTNNPTLSIHPYAYAVKHLST